jgi:flavin-dependent dehydrogenase
MLARAGWSAAVIERKSFPRRKVCGEFVSATTMPLLHSLGVLEHFSQLAGPEVKRVGLFAHELLLTAPITQPSNLSGRWGRALGRDHLDLLLLEAAARAGAKVWQPCSASQLLRSNNGYACTIATMQGTKQLAASIVIAAHGSWESGSLATHVAGAHTASDLLAFKARFNDCRLDPDLMPLLAFPGGYGGMVHSNGGRVSFSCCIRRDQLRQCRQLNQKRRAGEAVLQHIRRSCAGVDQALEGAKLDDVWQSAGPIRPGRRSCYREGIFLIGNCAGEAHPIVAEGITMGMQSAGLLCRRLLERQDDVAAGRGLGEIGDRYTSEWKNAFGLRLHAASVFAHLAMSSAATKLGGPIVKRFPSLLTIGAQLSGKDDEVLKLDPNGMFV